MCVADLKGELDAAKLRMKSMEKETDSLKESVKELHDFETEAKLKSTLMEEFKIKLEASAREVVQLSNFSQQLQSRLAKQVETTNQLNADIVKQQVGSFQV